MVIEMHYWLHLNSRTCAEAKVTVSDDTSMVEIPENKKKVIEISQSRISGDIDNRVKTDTSEALEEKNALKRLYNRIRGHLDDDLTSERQHELTRVLALLKRCDELNLTEDMKDIEL